MQDYVINNDEELEVAIEHSPGDYNAEHDSVIIEYCINRGIDINKRHGDCKCTILHYTVHKFDNDEFLNNVKLHIAHGANVNCEDDRGRTPLFYAASRRNVNIMTYLIQNGANVNTIDSGGNTALNGSTDYFDEGCNSWDVRSDMRRWTYTAMQLLLKSGANPNCGNPVLKHILKDLHELWNTKCNAILMMIVNLLVGYGADTSYVNTMTINIYDNYGRISKVPLNSDIVEFVNIRSAK